MRNYDKELLEAYRILFKKAGGDYDALIKNATINSKGEKEIPFMDYSNTKAEFKETIDFVAKKYKLEKWEKSKLQTTVALGCSPRFSD